MYLKANTNVEAILEVASLLTKEIEVLKEKANDVIPKPMEIKDYPSINSFTVTDTYRMKINLQGSALSMFEFKDGWGSVVPHEKVSVETLDSRKAAIYAAIEAYKKACLEVDEQNLVAIQNNTKIREKVKLIMSHIGVKDTYTTYEYKTNRSRTKTSTTHMAGWIGDMNRTVPIGPKNSKSGIDYLIRDVEETYKKILAKITEAKKEEEKKLLAAQKVHEMALLRAKYTPDNAVSDVSDILYAILAHDKYLFLGHHLQANRGDWSDGCNFAIQGLDGFAIETEEDQEIYDEINGYCEDWDGDGRVFRDCTWNYSVLFGKVAEGLYKDYSKIYEMWLGENY